MGAGLTRPSHLPTASGRSLDVWPSATPPLLSSWPLRRLFRTG